ncbi:MAG: tRNA pseudouridine(55) synthase TruB [Clostridia bacterium]|nr:tRNA pseudouridine(55) synthase TruB [Clostridia bacterium]
MENSRELCGLVIVNKEEGITSQGVVSRVKRIFGVKKAGHTGTLDPLATGVLPVLIGRGVKASEFMLTADKHYGATLLLGVTTDTEDVTGTVLSECEVSLSEDVVLEAISGFVGEIMQTPPMYSALKVGGQKLCDLARRGETVEREARPVTVYSIDAKRINEREYYLDVVCSKGTYIRTLCADIGKALGVGGTMKTLTRLSASGYPIDEARTLTELENMTPDERESLVIPIEDVFGKYESVTLGDFFARLARAGQEIYLHKIKKSFEVGTVLRIADSNGFFAVGEVREFEDGLAIKPIRQF